MRCQIIGTLNELENQQLKILASKRDELCEAIPCLNHWRDAVFAIYCKDVLNLSQEVVASSLPVVGGRKQLDDDEDQPTSKPKITETPIVDEPFKTLDAQIIHKTLFGGLPNSNSGNIFARDADLAGEFNKILEWIEDQMEKQDIDTVTLVALSSFAIVFMRKLWMATLDYRS
uniref:Uncharacterized protein n=1 Tax=Ditylenchus dipsaci TaxID=166011 RepID=A0A915CU07_9BILA